MTGLQKTLTENRIFNHLRNLCLVEKLFVQGLILAIVLVIIQSQLDSSRLSLTMYMPPIGFAFLVVITYFVQPILLGALNIFHNQHIIQNQRVASWYMVKRHLSISNILHS